MKFNFTETKKQNLILTFKRSMTLQKRNMKMILIIIQILGGGIHTEFGDNMNNYLKRIYNYDIEDNEDNESTMDIIYNEWGNWIQTNKTDE